MAINKVVIRLKGGLGNQLFIYAFGLSFSKKTNIEVCYDMFSGFIINDFKHLQTTKSLMKKYFKFISNISFWHHPLFYLLRKLRSKKFLNSTYLLGEFENLKSLEEKIIKEKGLFFIEGYFQNYQYIKDVIPEIKRTIKLKNLGVYQNLIRSNNSIAIHIRVNDYGVEFPQDYYEKAYLLISEKFKNYSLYIFSDNFSWCSENLSFFNRCKVVNSGDDEIDFHLMSLCNHHVITIGTFGWWAAILNNNENGIVVAPIVNYNFYNEKYYPDSWILI